MDKNGLISIIVVYFLLSSTSNASIVLNFRKLIAAAPPSYNSTPSQISPVPSPPTKADLINRSAAKASPPASVKKTIENNENSDNSEKSELDSSGSCEGSSNRCRDQNTMVACIQTFRNGSKEEVFLVVQNKGEGSLGVNISILTSVDNALPALKIPKHQGRRVDISSIERKSSKVILNAGNGECVLRLGRPAYVENFLQQLSFYSKQVTPLYGVYFVFLVAFLFGGTWVCCWFSKRRRQGGVPYVELEMGLPESASAVNVDTAEGWDQDWDDDWDEDDAAKSTGGLQAGKISANGLTSRSSRKEGWDNDWDD